MPTLNDGDPCSEKSRRCDSTSALSLRARFLSLCVAGGAVTPVLESYFWEKTFARYLSRGARRTRHTARALASLLIRIEQPSKIAHLKQTKHGPHPFGPFKESSDSAQGSFPSSLSPRSRSSPLQGNERNTERALRARVSLISLKGKKQSSRIRKLPRYLTTFQTSRIDPDRFSWTQ